MRERSVNIFSR